MQLVPHALEIEPADVLTPAAIAAVLDNLSKAAVAVVGDFCLDAYWTVNQAAGEISLETGRTTRPVTTQRYAPGGAGNVVMNLVALGVPRILPIGLLGEDIFGTELYRALGHPQIDRKGLLTQKENWQTHAYAKPYVDGVESERIDFGNFNVLHEATASALLERVREAVAEVSAVLINHQAAGSIHLSASFRNGLAELMETHSDVHFLVDSRGLHNSYPRGIHKLNEGEVLMECGREAGPDEVPLAELLSHAEALRSRWNAPLVVTRGGKGCVVVEGSTPPRRIFGVQLLGKIDPVGAGDTFVSALAASVAVGSNLPAAAFVANLAAAVTAQRLLQTGTASPAEILALGVKADFVYRPELAASPASAVYLAGSEIELVQARVSGSAPRFAIFDHDGTVSTLRQGWEEIMEPMMMRAILGEHFSRAEEPVFRRALARVREFIDKTTGLQTIEQMHGLRELVLEFGCIPPAAILEPAGYKAIFNEELKRLVNRRVDKLARGELEVADYTIKGAVSFLSALRSAGVTVYLASGTDDADVREEAERLGYADLFNGGIFGSLGMVGKDAKKLVLDRILREVNGAYHQLVTFGDGPVEMRETVKRGAYAIGIASDEVRRFGLNPAKRERLIGAGACLIAPDFSQGPMLLEFLELN